MTDLLIIIGALAFLTIAIYFTPSRSAKPGMLILLAIAIGWVIFRW